MRRRTLLAGAAAALAPRTSRAADATQPGAVWTLPARSGRLDISVRGASVECDWLPPGGAAAKREAAPALLLAGADRKPVTWAQAAPVGADSGALRLRLHAETQPLWADITFTHDDATGLVVRETTIHHGGDGAPVELRAALSFSLGLNEPAPEIVTLRGVWAQETLIHHVRQRDTPLVLQSRTGKTGFDMQPYAALLSDGAVTLLEVDWSGNWRIDIAPDDAGGMLSGGLNRWRLRHVLNPGASLTLPVAVFGRVAGRLNHATQALHDFRRARRPNPDRPIPVQFNSWYPYFGEPSSSKLLDLIPRAHALGCEVFVIDAGWYRPEWGDSAGDWEARLGDWRTSRDRFPNGLSELSGSCRRLGMGFGLWFEPESVGRLSALRHEHPEWLHWIGGHKPPDAARAVLNLGVPAARAHVLERMAVMVGRVGVTWLKWDFNTDLGAGGWAPGLPSELTAQDPLVAHVEGLYALQDALRARFPDLVLEMCASGGSRMDGAILSHAHVNWISDQPSPLRKLAIHFGSQVAHPAVVCNDWLVEWPPGTVAGYDDDTPEIAMLGDLPFRLHVAMLGSFGVSARIDRWPAADFSVVAAHVALYRDRLRAIIHHGDQFLLTRSPNHDGGGDWAAVWYVMKDGSQGVLFAFRLGSGDASRRFSISGLRPGPLRVDAMPAVTTEVEDAAVTVTLHRNFRSALLLVTAMPPE